MKLSIAFSGFGAIPPTIDVVRKAESLGLDGVWTAEHLSFHDGVVPTAAYAGVTERIELGIVGLSTAGRHPALLAMEIASLRELLPGRLRLAIGTGDPSLIAKLGRTIERPVQTTRAMLTSLREALAGRNLKLEHDAFRFDGFKLAPAGPVPPIDVMAIRPKMTELACELADGLSISIGASTQYLRDTVAEVERQLAERGRDRSSFRITALAATSIEDDLERARGPLPGLMAMGPPDSVAYLGRGVLDAEEVAAAAKGGMFALMKLMTPEVVDATTLAATPETLADRVAEYADTGIDELAVLPLGEIDTLPGLLEQFAAARP